MKLTDEKYRAIQSKLQKLMALSTSSNEHEAGLAMAKCQELMELHGIRTVDVDAETGAVGVSVESVAGYTARHSNWESKLAASLGRCFDCVALIQKGRTSWKILFIGATHDVSMVVDLYKRLRRTISQMSKEYSSYTEGNVKSLRHNYSFGLIRTVHQRLELLYRDLPTTTALVLVKKEHVDAKVHELFPRTRQQSAAKLTDLTAFMDGRKDGHRIRLNNSIAGETQQTIGG